MKRSERGIRYVVVGGFNTLFGLALFVALDLVLAAHVGHYVVLAIAQTVAIVQAHASQRRWVWRSDQPYLHELARFSSVYIGFFFVNLAFFYVAHALLSVPAIPAQIGITLLIVVGTFLLHRAWTFGRAGQSDDVPEGPVS